MRSLSMQKIFTFEDTHTYTEGMCHHKNGHMPMAWINQFESIRHKFELFQTNAFIYPYIQGNYEFPIIQ